MTTSSSAPSPPPRRATSWSPGIPGEEATVKTFARKGDKVVLRPANSAMVDLVFRADEVSIYGKVVSLLRRY